MLPRDPTKILAEAATIHKDIVEIVNDADIASRVDAARRLDQTSANLTHRASDHAAAQMMHETGAVTNAAGADRALTQAELHAKGGAAFLHDVAAQNHHIQGSSTAARAEDAGAKASALERVSQVQIAVQEESRRTEMGVSEVEDRTAAGVVKEMETLNAADETAEVAKNLEAGLAQAAGPAAPKV